jgi:hypothetical protein
MGYTGIKYRVDGKAEVAARAQWLNHLAVALVPDHDLAAASACIAAVPVVVLRADRELEPGRHRVPAVGGGEQAEEAFTPPLLYIMCIIGIWGSAGRGARRPCPVSRKLANLTLPADAGHWLALFG